MTITTQAVREMAERLRGHVNARGGSSLENGFWQRAINASDALLALVEERDRLAAELDHQLAERVALTEPERLLASPALADENHSDPEWGCEETAIAVTVARRTLEGSK